MTVSSATRKAGPYSGNGATTSFPFNFKVFTKDDIQAVLTSVGGANSNLVLDSDYSVVLNGDQDGQPGGTITYPITGNPLPAGAELTFVGDLEALQSTDITNLGGFYPEVIENALDYLTILVQQLQQLQSQAIIQPPTDLTPLGALPSALLRANGTLGFDSNGALVILPAGSVQNIFQQLGSSVVRSVNQKLYETISVKDFGAAGDGVTNDSAAIQNAINYVASLGGGVVYFPKGIYLCNVTLASGVTLRGGGGNNGYIAGGAGISAVTLKQYAAGPVVDTPAGAVTSCGVIGLDVQGGAFGANNNGIRFRNVSRGFVKQCAVDNFLDQGVLNVAGVANVFEDILTTNCLLTRGRTQTCGTVELQAGVTDSFLNRIEATTSQTGVSAGTLYCTGILCAGTNNFLHDSIGEISDQGIVVSGNFNRCTGLRSDKNWGGGFTISGAGNSLAACHALDNGQGANNTYDAYTISGTGNSFDGCKLFYSLANQMRYGFNDSVNTAAAASRNFYSPTCGGYGWQTALWNMNNFLGSSPLEAGVVVFINSGVTIPDTTDTTFIKINNAGATAITNFLGGYSGKTIRVLVQDANTTFNSTATIVTNTGANVAAGANKVYRFTQFQGVWYMDA